jgi:inhibitor of lysozyme (Ivy)
MPKFRWVLLMTYLGCSPAAAADAFLFDAIKKPAYARALTNLLDHAGNLPSWIRETRKTNGNYVASPGTPVAVNGITYELFLACKPHDCADSQLAIIFAPNGTGAWGALLDEDKPISYLGAPSEAQQAVLKRDLQR